MAIVEPGKGRAIIEHAGKGLRVTIPAATRYDVAACLALWLIFWLLGAVSIAHDLFSGRSGFSLMVGLLVMTAIGVMVLHWLLWQLAGKEIIRLDSASLRQSKHIPFFSRSREYAVADIANLRLTPPPLWLHRFGYSIPGLDFREGAISFDYGRLTHRLGNKLDEADARYVIKAMCEHVTTLCNGISEKEFETS